MRATSHTRPARSATVVDRQASAAVVNPHPHTADRHTVVPARAGDHILIHRLLATVLHRPSADEFTSSLDEPLYEPTDRLLVKDGMKLVAHVYLRKRVIQFGSKKLPIADVCQLVVLPEFRSRGLVERLLYEAEGQMAADGAVFGMVSTSAPRFFEELGWSVCGHPCCSSACPRDVLAQLQVCSANRRTLLGNKQRPLNIRLWRHVEQAALMRLYDQDVQGRWGANERTEAYWRWLVTRRAYDRIYVAIDGPDHLELDDVRSPIVGYAVVRDGCIFELVTSPQYATAAEQLLARACADAIEHDQHMVSLHAPPDSPIHEIIRANRRSRPHPSDYRDQVLMVKTFGSAGLLQRLADDFHDRAKAANLRRPCELGLHVSGRKLTLNIGNRKARISAGKLGRSYLTLDEKLLSQLLLGHLDVNAAVAAGHLEGSTRTAVETAAVLFPHLPFWRPPLDDLER